MAGRAVIGDGSGMKAVGADSLEDRGFCGEINSKST